MKIMSKVVLSFFVLGLTFVPSYSMKNETKGEEKKEVSKKVLFLDFLKCLHKTMSMYKNPLKKIEATSLEQFSVQTAECSSQLQARYLMLFMSFSEEDIKLLRQDLGAHFLKHMQGLIEGFSLVAKELKMLVDKKPKLLLCVALQDLLIKVCSPQIALLANFFATRYSIDEKEMKEAMPMLYSICKKFEEKKIFDETTYVKLDAKAVPRENLEAYKDAILLMLQKTHEIFSFFTEQDAVTENRELLNLATSLQLGRVTDEVVDKLSSAKMKKLFSETEEKYQKYLVCFLAESFKNFYKNNKDLLTLNLLNDFLSDPSKTSGTIDLLIKNLEIEMINVLDGVYGKTEKKEEFLIAIA